MSAAAAIDRPATDTLRPIRDNIPPELQVNPQVVVWRWEPAEDGRRPKVPYTPGSARKARCNDPATWRTFDQAAAAYDRGGFDGLAYALTEQDEIVCWDVDDCRDAGTGELADWVQPYLRLLNSYGEVSPSGTGVKVLVRARLAPGARNVTPKGAAHKVECYAKSRFVTLTGHRLPGYPATIQERQAEVDGLHRAVIGERPAGPERPPAPAQPVDLDDAALLDRAKAARNGALFERLWKGDRSGHGGDDSGADLALCNLLAFWTGRDGARMDQLFRLSGLFREKWDAVHFSSGQTYGQHTVEQAIQGCRAAYTPAPLSVVLTHGRPAGASPPGARPALTPPAGEPAGRAGDPAAQPDAPCEDGAYAAPLRRENEQLRQRVAELEDALAAGLERERELLRQRNEDRERYRHQLDEERDHYRRRQLVLKNPTLKPATRLAVLGLADVLEETGRAAGTREQGERWTPIYLAAVADRAALNERSVGAEVQQVADLGLIDKHTTDPKPKRKKLPNGREHRVLCSELYVRATADELIDRAAAIRAPDRNHGGPRKKPQATTIAVAVPATRCEQHPEGALTARTTFACPVDGQVVGAPVLTAVPAARCDAQLASHSHEHAGNPDAPPAVEVPRFRETQLASHNPGDPGEALPLVARPGDGPAAEAPAPAEGPGQAGWTGARQRPPRAPDRCPWGDCPGRVCGWTPCEDREGWEVGRCSVRGDAHVAYRSLSPALAGGGSG
jgi:hypothetical protein